MGKLAEFFVLLKTTQIRVITIVVVLDQSTITFQKGWLDQSTVIFQKGGITFCVVLRLKEWQCYVLSVGC